MAISTGANVPKVSAADIEQAERAYIAKLGRPSSYSASVAAEICARLKAGETLTAICKDSHMPAIQTVMGWKCDIANFGEMYARARRAAATSMVDAGLDLLDSMADDPEATMVKVRIAEMRHKAKFELAKCHDRATFGDKQTVDISGSIEHTVGGILETVLGQSRPLIIDAECRELLPE